MIGDQNIVSADSGATGSASFNTHKSGKVVICVHMTGAGQTCKVQIEGKTTQAQTKASVIKRYKTITPDIDFTFALDNAPMSEVTVRWKDNTGALSADVFVGRVDF